MSELRDRLKAIKTFPSLVRFLRDELDWPIDSTDDFEDLTFDYSPEELGIDEANAAKIDEIKRLRPLSHTQPWGIFFVKFEPKQLPVVALRRILNRVVVKKRARGSAAEQQRWATDDLLFISAYGDEGERRISFAHFSQDPEAGDLATLKVLAWDEQDTGLHLDDVANRLVEHLSWPADADEWDGETWRETWSAAFELRHREVVTTSKALAIELAHLARAIRVRINDVLAIENHDGPVTGLMKAFREALVHDLNPDDFGDMYAQTIAYGLLSARVANPSGDGSAENLPVTNPFLKELMETFLRVGIKGKGAAGAQIDFDELGVTEVVELLDHANMEAVIRDFGDQNPLEDPVIHFYELFLKEYDAKKRMQRGVFYTPRPVVSYLVRSVDEVLRNEFDLEDGLADVTTWAEMSDRHNDIKIPDGTSPDQAFVQILDPAAGTGTFLVEVIDRIHKNLIAKWKAQGRDAHSILVLWNEYVPKHLLPRLHGYELLMAPYAVAHLKIGLKLFETGYDFASGERVRVYLTNSLEPALDFSGQFDFASPALAHEAQAVNDVKRHHRFTVLLGNPPYSIMSGNLSGAARGLVESFREVDGVRIREKSAIVFERTLQDDYVKFYALARSLLSSAGVGVNAYISNSSFQNNINLRGMRCTLLDSYQAIRLLDLHGVALLDESSSGTKDENVFDIRTGVAIFIAWTSVASATEKAIAKRSDFFGNRQSKFDRLLSTSIGSTDWTIVYPRSGKYSFLDVDSDREQEFEAGISLEDLFDARASGIQTGKDSILIDFDREKLAERLRRFGDSSLSDATVTAEFDAEEGYGEKLVRKRESILHDPHFSSRFTPLMFSPFDTRVLFYRKDLVKVHSDSISRELLAGTNVALVVMRQVVFGGVFSHVFVSRHVVNQRSFYSTRGTTYMIPFRTSSSAGSASLLDAVCAANVRSEYAAALSPPEWGREADSFDDLMALIYAQVSSPSYRARYDAVLRTDYPRVFAPKTRVLQAALSEKGRELIELHLLESPALDRRLTTYAGPANPTITRVGWLDETVWLDAAAAEKGAARKPGTIGFRGVSESVWKFQIGGYQVCHKWLKDRRGRTLSDDDIAHYQKIVVAISETIRLMGEIDEVIEEHGGWPDAFVAAEPVGA